MATQKQIEFIQKLTPKLLAEKPDVKKCLAEGDEKYARFYMRKHISYDMDIYMGEEEDLNQRAAEYDAAVTAIRSADLTSINAQQASALIDALKAHRILDAAKAVAK